MCGAAFSKNGGLSRHRKIHTGEKPFVCYICGKGFNQRGNLKTHMKSHINGTLQPPKEQPIWIKSTKWQNYNGCVSGGPTLLVTLLYVMIHSFLFLHLYDEKKGRDGEIEW